MFEEPHPFRSDEDIDSFKRQFAEELLRTPDTVFAAAQRLFPIDTGRAMYAATKWVKDALVLTEKARLLRAHGARAFLPTKEDVAREIWATAIDKKTPVEDRRSLLSLYCDIMGYKEAAAKNAAGGGNGGRISSSVMRVRDHGSNDAWERAAAKQQHLLTHAGDVSDATVKH